MQLPIWKCLEPKSEMIWLRYSLPSILKVVDGDKLLVIDDELLVNIAERNIQKYDIVPLFYNMKKADSVLLNKHVLYDGMIKAYTGGNIGIVSNNISKMWNSFKKAYPSTTEEEMVEIEKHNQDTLRAIKLMCMENNFVID